MTRHVSLEERGRLAAIRPLSSSEPRAMGPSAEARHPSPARAEARGDDGNGGPPAAASSSSSLEIRLRTRIDVLTDQRDNARAEAARLRQQVRNLMRSRTSARRNHLLWRHRALDFARKAEPAASIPEARRAPTRNGG